MRAGTRRASTCAVGALVMVMVGLASVIGGSSPAAANDDDVVCDGAAGVGHLEVLGDPAPAGVPAVAEPLPEDQLAGREHMRRFAVDIEVEADGDLVVTEDITYDFADLERHGIYRTVVTRQRCTDSVDRITPVGAVVAQSRTASAELATEQVEDGVKIRLGSASEYVTGVHDYRLTYGVRAAANGFPDRVELYWNVVGSAWEAPLADVSVTVHGPGDPLRVDCFTGSAGSDERCDAMAVDGATASFGEQIVWPGENMTVAVAFPSDEFDLRPLVFEEKWSLKRAFTLTPLVVAASVLFTVGGLFVVVLLAYRIGRDRRAEGAAVDVAFANAAGAGDGVPVPLGERAEGHVEFAPPDGIRPAQLGLVVSEKVDGAAVAATIVDLAGRGYLRIEEHGKDYRLVRLTEDYSATLGYEERLLRSLFSFGDQIELGTLSGIFHANYSLVCDMVYDDAINRGWFPARPDKVRARWRGLGGLLLVLSLLALGGAVAWTSSAVLAIPPVVVSLALVVLAGRFPRRTPVGTGVYRRALGFRQFIDDSEAPRARWAEQRSIFTDYLPYAIVLGCATRWAETFEPLGAAALESAGAWYVGDGVFSADRLVVGTSRFSSVAGRSLSSVPAPESSSSGSSGSSGFSGGSSGGGGGGGGGGSW